MNKAFLPQLAFWHFIAAVETLIKTLSDLESQWLKNIKFVYVSCYTFVGFSCLCHMGQCSQPLRVLFPGVSGHTVEASHGQGHV